MLSKVSLFFQLAHEQGLLKTLGYLWRRFVRRGEYEPAPNTISMNRWVWSRIDWSKGGEEWTSSPAWKQGFVTHVLEPNIPMGSRVLEIGPGAGRWTECIIPRAAHLIGVDVTPKCVEICKERFKGVPNVEFHLNDGRDLSFIAPRSIDRIWSVDVFVHINAVDVENYMRQFAQLLAPGGVGLIHHAKSGQSKREWRSDMTAEKMREFCAKYGLNLMDQFEEWDNGRASIHGKGTDIISVFAKPK